MAIYVQVDGQRAIVAVNGTIESLGNLSRLYSKIAPVIRDMVRSNITYQRGGSGSWAPLAKSTREKTGRRKALITLRPHIIARSNADEATAVFNLNPVKWSLMKHKIGFRVPERVPSRAKVMHWSTSNGAVFAARAKASVIPPRNIYPTAAQVSLAILPVVEAWIMSEALRGWR